MEVVDTRPFTSVFLFGCEGFIELLNLAVDGERVGARGRVIDSATYLILQPKMVVAPVPIYVKREQGGFILNPRLDGAEEERFRENARHR